MQLNGRYLEEALQSKNALISRNKNIIEKVPYKGRNSAITVLFAFLFQVDTLPNEGSVVERSRAHWSRASLATLDCLVVAGLNPANYFFF